MKRPILSLLFLILCINVYAQAPYIQWEKSLGGSLLESAQYGVQTFDSGYVVVGTAESNNMQVSGNHGPYDIWVVKLTPTGSIAWQKCFGGSLSDNGMFIQQTSDSGYIFVGNARSNDSDITFNHGSIDIWVVKLSPTGSLVWQKTYGGSGWDAVHCIKQTADGGYIVGGRSNSTNGDVTGNHGDFDMWVLKLSSTGSLTWQKSYGGSGYDDVGNIEAAYDGGYVVGGTTASNDGEVSGNHGGEDYWIIKINDTGALTWQKCLGGSGTDDIICESCGSGGFGQTSDSGIIATGWSNSTDGDVTGNHGSYDYWLVKLSGTGSLLWQKSYGGTGDDEATSLQQTTDGGYILAGTSVSNDGDVSGNHGGYDYWLVKVSDTGALQWQKSLGGNWYSPGDCANSVRQTMGGGYVVTGYSNAPNGDVTGNHGDFDYWVVKLNCTLPVVGTISGSTVVCAGLTISLTDTTAGGVWTSGSGNASVLGGVVSGISAGIAVINYTVANTCGAVNATYTITINPLPMPVITATGAVLSTTIPFTTYQWLSGGSPITGATNATYTVTHSGSYSVIVTDANGCTDTSSLQAVIPEGVNNIYSGSGITILPNPTTGFISITGSGNIRVYNIIGQLLKQTVNTENISIAEFPAGLYFVKVFNEQGELLKQDKVIKH